jgi:oligogalacturonide lyase
VKRRPAERLTDGRWNAQHLYFTGATLTSDDRRIVLIGDRDRPARGPYDPEAAVNVFVLDRQDRSLEPISANSDGIRRSYVYFGGHEGRGIAPGSVALHPGSGSVYYLQGDSVIRSSCVDGSLRPIAEIERGFVTGYGAVSADGSRYGLPGIARAAFGNLNAIDGHVRRSGLSSHVWVFDTATGRLVEDLEVPGAWVTHIQFHPARPTVLLLNHEWAEQAGEHRLWLRDGSGVHPLRTRDRIAAGTPISLDDYVDHEIWSRDGTSIVYHGTYAPGDHPLAGRSFIGRVAFVDGSIQEIPFPRGFDRYGHFGVGPRGQLVTDGYADFGSPRNVNRPWPGRFDGAEALAEDDGGAWISQVDVDWDAARIGWIPIGRHGSSWWSQDSHPHPTFDQGGREILFTSDRGGFRAIYAVRAIR